MCVHVCVNIKKCAFKTLTLFAYISILYDMIQPYFMELFLHSIYVHLYGTRTHKHTHTHTHAHTRTHAHAVMGGANPVNWKLGTNCTKCLLSTVKHEYFHKRKAWLSNHPLSSFFHLCSSLDISSNSHSSNRP